MSRSLQNVNLKIFRVACHHKRAENLPTKSARMLTSLVSDKELVDSIRFLLQAIVYWLPWNEHFLFSLILFFLLHILYNASKVGTYFCCSWCLLIQATISLIYWWRVMDCIPWRPWKFSHTIARGLWLFLLSKVIQMEEYRKPYATTKTILK